MIVSRLISEHGNHLPPYADSQSFWKNVWVSALQESRVLTFLDCLWKAELIN